MRRGNKISFNLSLIKEKTFGLFVDGFAFATSLFFRIRNTIRITVIPKFTTKMLTTINSRRIRLVFSQVKLITKPVWTLNSRRIRISYTIRENLKAITLIDFSHPMTFVSKGIQKLIVPIKTGILEIDFEPTLGQFVLLGALDPDTLGTLDPEILEDLDFTAA